VSTVANADQQNIDEDGVSAMCGGGRHRRKHWIADDGCNECKCSSKSTMVDNVDDKSAVMSCTNMWCGPATFDCLSGVMPCTGTNQVTFTTHYYYPSFVHLRPMQSTNDASSAMIIIRDGFSNHQNFIKYK